MPKGKLKAKGTVTQGSWVEEPGCPDHQFLCAKEVGTPKASFNWGKIILKPTLLCILRLCILLKFLGILSKLLGILLKRLGIL